MRRKEELGETQREEREWGGREKESKEGKKEMKKNEEIEGYSERESAVVGERRYPWQGFLLATFPGTATGKFSRASPNFSFI